MEEEEVIGERLDLSLQEGAEAVADFFGAAGDAVEGAGDFVGGFIGSGDGQDGGMPAPPPAPAPGTQTAPPAAPTAVQPTAQADHDMQLAPGGGYQWRAPVYPSRPGVEAVDLPSGVVSALTWVVRSGLADSVARALFRKGTTYPNLPDARQCGYFARHYLDPRAREAISALQCGVEPASNDSVTRLIWHSCRLVLAGVTLDDQGRCC